MSTDFSIDSILERSDDELPVVRVVVAATEGSAPREAGAAMIVDRTGCIGTIGGGQLEFEAIERAKEMLQAPAGDAAIWLRELRSYPLGPKLAQCCGGMVRVLFERFGRHEVELLKQGAQNTTGTLEPGARLLVRPIEPGPALQCCRRRQDARGFPVAVAKHINRMLSGEAAAKSMLVGKPGGNDVFFIEALAEQKVPLFIYGAGHVGRAIVRIAADLAFDTHWVDTDTHRFPQSLPDNVTRVVAREPSIIARSAPAGAFHLVLTYSHALDLAICHTLLEQNVFGFLGLIGSATKRARFVKRLSEGGVEQKAIARMTCPIGITNLNGKSPTTIAVSVAAQLIELLEQVGETGRLEEGGGLERSNQLSA